MGEQARVVGEEHWREPPPRHLHLSLEDHVNDLLARYKMTSDDVVEAVEALLKVKVEKVNVLNIRGKVKRLGRFSGRRSDWKKAFVTLKEGEKLELFESV